MNLGVYIPSLGPSQDITDLFNTLNEYVEQGTFDDISLFYDDVNFCPVDAKFGLFNAADLWNFTGTLLCYSLDIVPKLKNTINNFEVVIVDTGSRNILSILKAMEEYPLVATSESHAKYLKRVTGKDVRVSDPESLLFTGVYE